MDLAAFDFPFDASLIASRPVEPRDQARLLVVDRQSDTFSHRRVADLPALLHAGDLLVVNDTKVVPARLTARRVDTGKAVDILFVRQLSDGDWEGLFKGRARVGQQFQLAPDATATLLQRDQQGTILRINSQRPLREILEAQGRMPLPPYIKRDAEAADRHWYQTTFAREEGAVAAPTAGLHLTDEVRTRLAACGIGWASVTLHVGPGTFKPVTATRVDDHQMDAERWELPDSTAAAVRDTRQRQRRVVAVGTTVVRTLETSAAGGTVVQAGRGETALFIRPGYRFQAVDAMLTNFHLPKTTLLMLVSAFAGVDRMREAYRVAIQERYRFYSYGDAMLIV